MENLRGTDNKQTFRMTTHIRHGRMGTKQNGNIHRRNNNIYLRLLVELIAVEQKNASLNVSFMEGVFVGEDAVIRRLAPGA